MTLSRLLRHLYNTQGHTYSWLPFESVFPIRMRIGVPVHVMMWRLPGGVLVLYMWRRRHQCGQWYWGNEMDASWKLGWKSLRNIRCGGLLHLPYVHKVDLNGKWILTSSPQQNHLFSRGASNKYHRSSVSLIRLHLPVENSYTLILSESYDDIRRSFGAVFFLHS